MEIRIKTTRYHGKDSTQIMAYDFRQAWKDQNSVQAN